MQRPNSLLRAARERLPSTVAPGEHASRAEVAEAVNAWLWATTGRMHALDAHYLAKLERGVARWPNAAYRSGLRHVLSAVDDAALGFVPPRRATGSVRRPATPAPAWSTDVVVERANSVTDHDLVPPSRRLVLAGVATLVGTALVRELQPFLWPAARGDAHHGSAFSSHELDAVERLVRLLRSWHSTHGALTRPAVIAQLGAHVRRLRTAPQGTRETLRGFRLGAELADIAATMSWDSGEHASAQSYFVLATQLAHVAGEDTLAAVALASLSRQCFDLGRPDDGLEVVQLAQYGTRNCATPRLRAVLATREAWAHALRGDTQAFRRAVGAAEDYYGDGTCELDLRTPSTRSLDEAELAGVIGARYRDLSRHAPAHARTAQAYIGRALRLRDPDRVRNRAFDLVGLARAHLITREPDRAAELIQSALPDAATWTAGRVGARLRDFHREAAVFAAVPEVRAARNAIGELLAA